MIQGLLEDGAECEEIEGHEPLSCEQFKFFNSFSPEDYSTTRTKKVVDKDNRDFMQNFTRPCPTCKKRIMRSEGCKHMRCPCGTSFCWNCKFVYRHDHQEHDCRRETRNRGDFDANVGEVQETVVDAEKEESFNRTREQIRINVFDLDVLTYRFKGQDPTVLDNYINQETEPGSRDNVWSTVTDAIQNQFDFGFSFPWHFLR